MKDGYLLDSCLGSYKTCLSCCQMVFLSRHFSILIEKSGFNEEVM